METEEKKKHKLLLIAPSGKEYELGFLSPSRDGVVLGTPKVEDVDTSHLTVIVKGDTRARWMCAIDSNILDNIINDVKNRLREKIRVGCTRIS